MGLMKLDDADVLAAIEGYKSRMVKIALKMDEIERRLGRNPSSGRKPAVSIVLQRLGVATLGQKKPHKISPEGRARIAEAQRRRWKQAKAAGRKSLKGPRKREAA